MIYILRRLLLAIVTAPIVGAVWLFGYVALAVIANAPLPPLEYLKQDAVSWSVIYIVMLTFYPAVAPKIHKFLGLD